MPRDRMRRRQAKIARHEQRRREVNGNGFSPVAAFANRQAGVMQSLRRERLKAMEWEAGCESERRKKRDSSRGLLARTEFGRRLTYDGHIARLGLIGLLLLGVLGLILLHPALGGVSGMAVTAVLFNPGARSVCALLGWYPVHLYGTSPWSIGTGNDDAPAINAASSAASAAGGGSVRFRRAKYIAASQLLLYSAVEWQGVGPSRTAITGTTQGTVIQVSIPATQAAGATFTGNTNATTTVSSVSSFAGLFAGMPVFSSGNVPRGTYIAAMNSYAGTITLSQAATSTATGVTITPFNPFVNVAGTLYAAIRGIAFDALAASTANSIPCISDCTGAYCSFLRVDECYFNNFGGQSICHTGEVSHFARNRVDNPNSHCYHLLNTAANVLTGVNGAGQSFPTGTLTVTSTAGFQPSGTVTVAGVTGTVSYTGKTPTTFTGCTGGTGTATNTGGVTPVAGAPSSDNYMYFNEGGGAAGNGSGPGAIGSFIALEGSGYNTLVGNEGFNCAYGFLLTNAQANRLIGNRGEKMDFDGMRLTGSNTIENVVVGNYLWNNGWVSSQNGISIFASANLNLIADNHITNDAGFPGGTNMQVGIALAGSAKRNRIRGNQIFNPQAIGIKLSGATHNALTGNVVDTCQQDGFFLDAASSDNQLGDNYVYRASLSSNAGYNGFSILSNNNTLSNCHVRADGATNKVGNAIRFPSGATGNVVMGGSAPSGNWGGGAAITDLGAGNYIKGFKGWNDVTGKVANCFKSDAQTPANRIGPGGSTGTATASTAYTAEGADLMLAVSGGTGVSITVADPAGNTVQSALATYAGMLPFGYTINFGAFSVAPTVYAGVA